MRVRVRAARIDPGMWISMEISTLSYRAKGVLADSLITGMIRIKKNPNNAEMVEGINELERMGIITQISDIEYVIREDMIIERKVRARPNTANDIAVAELSAAWNKLTSQQRIMAPTISRKVILSTERYPLEEIKEAFRLLDEACNDGEFFYCYQWNFERFLIQANGLPNWVKNGKMYLMYNAFLVQKQGKKPAFHAPIKEF